MARGRRKDCPDVSPRIRRAFITACKRNGGHSYLANKIENSLEKDFIGTLNALAKFNPKIQNVNNTNTLEIKIDSSVENWVAGYQSALQDNDKPALEHVESKALVTVDFNDIEPETALEGAGSEITPDPTLPHRVKEIEP